MHLAQGYISQQGAALRPGGHLLHGTLSAAQATALQSALSADAISYLYSGAVSIGDAAQATERSLFTWASVKLYYSAFYLARCMLALHGTAIFYDGSKAFSWRAVAGASPNKAPGQTHKVVLSLFSAQFPSSALVTQRIGVETAFDWLIARREEANYTIPRFVEPAVPAHFSSISASGLRRSLSAYVKDDTYLYAFDAQHAILAFPLEMLKKAVEDLRKIGAPGDLNADSRKYLSSLFFDRAGPLAEIAEVFKR